MIPANAVWTDLVTGELKSAMVVAVVNPDGSNVSTGGGGGATGGLTNAELRAAAVAVSSASLSSLDTNTGARADVRATWYDSAASLVALLKLSIAAYIGAGSHTYGYTGGQLTTDAWTLFGVTRTKTYTYTAGVLAAESDWL